MGVSRTFTSNEHVTVLLLVGCTLFVQFVNLRVAGDDLQQVENSFPRDHFASLNTLLLTLVVPVCGSPKTGLLD